MKASGFLVVNNKGVDRHTTGRPTLRQGELAIPYTVDIPDALFNPPSIPRVTITLADLDMPQIEIVQEVMDKLEAAKIKFVVQETKKT